MKKFVILLAAALFVLTAGAAFAAVESMNLTVSASVSGNCRVTGVTNITFLTAYDTLDPANNDSGSGNFTYRCTKGTTYWLYITGSRQMSQGAELLNFDLYTDAGRGTVWPAVNPGGPGTISASNNELTVDVFGRIPALQNVAAGPYSGTVAVTVEF